MKRAPLASKLPWWTSRTCQFDEDRVSFLIMTDGSMVCALRAKGKDLHSSDDSALNDTAHSLRQALNELPQHFFLQCEWESGSQNFDEIIADFENIASKDAHEVLKEQRRARAEAFRCNPTLFRGDLTIWIGVREPFHRITDHANKSGRIPFLPAFLQRKRKLYELVTAERVHEIGRAVFASVRRMQSALHSSGMTTSLLDESELLKKCYQAVNPGSSAKVPSICDSGAILSSALRDGKEPVIKSLSLREQMPNGGISCNENTFSIGEPPLLGRCLFVNRFPSHTFPHILGDAQYQLDFPHKLSITHESVDSDKIKSNIERRRKMLESVTTGISRDINAEETLHELEEISQKMLAEDEKVFETSVNLVVYGKTPAELDRNTLAAKELFSKHEIGFVVAQFEQFQTFLSTLPGNGYKAPEKARSLSNNAAHLLLASVPSEGDRSADMLYHGIHNGICKVSLGEDKPSKHCLMFGGTGSGKSFHVSTIIEDALARGAHVTIIDVQGPEISSYRRLTELFGGKYYALAAQDLEISLNPFVPHKDFYNGDKPDEDQVGFLKKVLVLMASSALLKETEAEIYMDIAQTAIEQSYLATSEEGRTPTISDIVDFLEKYETTDEDDQECARKLYRFLGVWMRDSRKNRLFNNTNGFNLGGKFSVFDFYGLKEDAHLAEILLFICSHLVWNQLRSLPKGAEKLIVFDEAWALIASESGQDLIESLYRTARKFNGCVFAISQASTDVVQDSIVNNTSTFFLQKHSSGLEEAAEVCSLNERQKTLFKDLKYESGHFADCLMVDKAKKEATVLRLKPTPFDLWVNTTKPSDLALREKIQEEQGTDLLGAIHYLSQQFPNGAPEHSSTRGERK